MRGGQSLVCVDCILMLYMRDGQSPVCFDCILMLYMRGGQSLVCVDCILMLYIEVFRCLLMHLFKIFVGIVVEIVWCLSDNCYRVHNEFLKGLQYIY